jgi:Fe-S-cluster containining protein
MSSSSSEADQDCSCKTCRTACEVKPGWFLPGEAEKAADYMGLSIEDFFRQYLLVDYYFDDDDKDIFVLSPGILESKSGQEYPGDPHGTCIFYKDGKCSIHPVKPYECRKSIHDEGWEAVEQRHEYVARTWSHDREAGNKIRKLLGREPQAESWGMFDAIMREYFFK